MTLEQYAYLAEIIAAIAVISSLVYLGVQVRQSNLLARAQTRHELTANLIELLQVPGHNPQLAGLIRRANEGEDLNPDEAEQYLWYMRAVFRHWEDAHYQYRAGLYDEAEFSKQREAWVWVLRRSKAAMGYWNEFRSVASTELVVDVERLLAQTDAGRA
jgi:hypothetical protein